MSRCRLLELLDSDNRLVSSFPSYQRTANATVRKVQKARDQAAQGLSHVRSSGDGEDVVGEGLCGADECLLFEIGRSFIGPGKWRVA